MILFGIRLYGRRQYHLIQQGGAFAWTPRNRYNSIDSRWMDDHFLSSIYHLIFFDILVQRWIVNLTFFFKGKTSLCRALAQKISIRLSDRYHHTQLVEINSHSLFSKFVYLFARILFQFFVFLDKFLKWNKIE